MVINPFHTQKVIEAYNQQLTIRARISSVKAQELVPKDTVTLSEMGKKMLAAGGGAEGAVPKSKENHGALKKGG